MGIRTLLAGNHLPEDFYTIIEVPALSVRVKYEMDKTTGLLFVDRFLKTAMVYPCNYGYINRTLALDGDPVDVLVLSPCALQPAAVIRCRPVALLKMSDEAGIDAKVIAVPHDKVSQEYSDVKDIEDLSPRFRAQLQHFFEQYKALDEGKWVTIEGWADADAARAEIMAGAKRYQEMPV